MGRAADDHRVNGCAAATTACVSTTLGRWASKKGRMAGHSSRRAVRVRVATGGGDVMRRRLGEEMSVGWESISGRMVRWRWWEQVHGLLVTRGFAVRNVTALRGSSYSGSGTVGRLRVQTSVSESHLLKD
jgi:hypothetical protein